MPMLIYEKNIAGAVAITDEGAWLVGGLVKLKNITVSYYGWCKNMNV